VAGLCRNARPDWNGIGGRFASEYTPLNETVKCKVVALTPKPDAEQGPQIAEESLPGGPIVDSLSLIL